MPAARRIDNQQWWTAFGAAITEARTKAGLTQTQLGQRVGLSRGSIGNIEAGRQHVLADTAAKLATEIGVHIPGWPSDPDATLLAERLNITRTALRDTLDYAEAAAGTAREALDEP